MNRASSATSRSKSQRVEKGEADPPNAAFHSHSAKTTAINKPVDRKSPRRSVEKRPSFSRAMEVQQAQEELAKLKEQLGAIEIAKTKALEEAAELKSVTDELSNKLNEAIEASNKDRLRAVEMEHASFTAAEEWQAELEDMKKQYETEVTDLQTSKTALENLKQELLASIEAKDEAVKVAAEAMSAAQMAAKRADEVFAELTLTKDSLDALETAAGNFNDLMTELSDVKKALSEAHDASETIAVEVAAAVAVKEAALNKMLEDASYLKAENDSLKQELALAKELQTELNTMRDDIQSLKDELVIAKEVGQKESLAAAEAYLMLEKLKADIELRKMAEKEALDCFVSLSPELQEAQQDLGISMTEAAVLVMNLDSLKSEVERNEIELAEMKDMESKAAAEISALTEELVNAQFQLSQAVVTENEAQESLEGLSSSLQNLRKETQEAKEETLIVHAESQRRRHEGTVALSEAENARSEVQNAREMISKLEAEAQAVILETQKEKASAEADRAQVKASRREIEVAKSEAEAARAEIEVARNRILAAQKDTQIAQLKIQEAESEAQAEIEQARTAKEENEKAQLRVNQLKAELERARLEIGEALNAKREAEKKLKDVMREIEGGKAISDSCNQDRNLGHSEAWETAESAPVIATISEEEHGTLKTKLQEAEMLVTERMAEIDAAKARKEELSGTLADASKEAEASKEEALHVHQQVEEVQKGNLMLEAEVQKLILEIKKLEEAKEFAKKESFDLAMDGDAIPLNSQEKMLHLDSLGHILNLDLSTFHRDQENDNDENIPSSIKKKKKKALLLRIGSYLTKTRNTEKQ